MVGVDSCGTCGGVTCSRVDRLPKSFWDVNIDFGSGCMKEEGQIQSALTRSLDLACVAVRQIQYLSHDLGCASPSTSVRGWECLQRWEPGVHMQRASMAAPKASLGLRLSKRRPLTREEETRATGCGSGLRMISPKKVPQRRWSSDIHRVD